MSNPGSGEPILTTDFILPSASDLEQPGTEHLTGDLPVSEKQEPTGTEPAASRDIPLGATTAPTDLDSSSSPRKSLTAAPLGGQTQSFDNLSAIPVNGSVETRLSPGRIPGATSTGEMEIDASSAKVKPRSTKEIAGYELLSVLGRGGMGVVYKARHKGLNRTVALKMLLAGGHASEGQLKRFNKEGRAVARLQHPNIVQIFDVGAQDGLHYFAMEMVDGGSLEQLVQGTPQSARAAAGMVEALARAIHHAHEHGIIHRDLKPANILLQRKAADASLIASSQTQEMLVANGQPSLSDFEGKIADFGLAKFLDSEEGQTRTGTVAGTPSYMSPEQASGRTKDTGPSTDIYSLGAILYKLLTGRPPFHADTAVDTLNQVVSIDPVAPTRLQPKVPRDLETICLKCLTKEPHKRYRTAHDLAEDLRRFQAKEPITARPTPTWERVGKWARRRPTVAALSVLLAIVTISGVGLVTEQWLRAETERDRAEQEKERAEKTAESEAQQKALAEKRRIEAQRVSAGLLRERGLALCERGKYGEGLLWLARALENVPAEAKDLDASIRTLLGGWSRHVGRVTRLFDHRHDVMAAALSPDGQTVATGSLDGKLRLWDSATGRLRRDPLQGSAGQVQVVIFSPDGQLILTGSSDGVVSMWRTANGALVWQEKGHGDRVQSAAFSTDGRWIATGGFDSTARLWEAATGKPRGQPLRHQGRVTGVAFAPDGSRLLTAGLDRTVRLWDVKTGQAAVKPWQLRHEVWALALSADGKLAATGELDGDTGYLRLWEVSTGKPMAEKRWPVALVVGGVTRGFCNLAFSPDGEMLLTGTSDGTAQLWRALDLKPLGEPLRHQPNEEVTGVAFSADGRKIVTGGRDGTARLWDISAMLASTPLLRQTGHVRGILFSPDSRRLLTLCGDAGQVRDAGTGQPIGPPLRHQGPVSCAAFNPDGSLAAIGDQKGILRVWETATGRPRGKELVHPNHVHFVLFHPKGEWLITGCRDNRVRFWDTNTGRMLGEPLAHEDILSDRASLSPDGEILLTIAGPSARLWRVATRSSLGAPLRHQSMVSSAAFSPDGKRVATASFDKTVRLWDVATAKPAEKHSLHEEQAGLTDVAFSPSGETILTRGGDTVRLWSSRDWQPLGVLRHASHVLVSSFSRDGRMVVTGGFDKTLRFWDAATGQPMGEPLSYPGNVLQVALRPDSRMLACVQWDDAGDLVRLLPIAPPMHGEPATIARQIRVNTSLELDASGAATWLGLQRWEEQFREQTALPLAVK